MKIYALKYKEACYFKRKVKQLNKKFKFVEHVCLGYLKIKNDCLVVSFEQKNDKQPVRGLIIPRSSIILKPKIKAKKHIDIEKIKTGDKVEIFWKDISYFEEGIKNINSSLMITTGELFLKNSEAVILKNTQTIKVGEKIRRHPERKISFCAIPQTVIYNIKTY